MAKKTEEESAFSVATEAEEAAEKKEKKAEEKAMDGSNKHAEEPVKKLLLLP